MSSFVIDDTYRNKLFLYLNSFDDKIDRDLLEVDIYDELYMRECYDKLYLLAEDFYVKCKLENRKDIGFRYDSYEWRQVKAKEYVNEMIRTYGSLESIPENILHPIKAYFNFEHGFDYSFGKIVGRSTDRYDYFMYLKYGMSYEPKYITKKELNKILKDNKYGYSAHCIF